MAPTSRIILETIAWKTFAKLLQFHYCAMSELWERKVRTYFKHFDVKGTGVITLKDGINMAENYSDAEKVTDWQREETRNTFRDIFREWKKSAGTGDDGVVTASIFVESIRQQRNDPDFKAVYMKTLRHFFKIVDLNGDGYLQKEEVTRAYSEILLPDVSFVHSAFECLDLNKDGKVSLEEYSTAIFEYLTSEDEKSPYNMIFGPLV